MANKTDIYQQIQSIPAAGAQIDFYEIRVKGQLDESWLDWLDGLEVKLLDNGEMILFGPIVDQAALIGVLNKLSRLNLALLAVNKDNCSDDGGNCPILRPQNRGFYPLA